ncbi:MAG TPA: TetR/AcrR family transcriptional regulator [Polyangiaceae bacterium]
MRESAPNDRVAEGGATPPKVDGRHARAARTHVAIVSALLDLADEGELAPTAQAVATRAKVALRSIRQHFPTREELFVAAAEEHARRVSQSKPAEIPAGLTLVDRIDRFLAARTRQLEGSSALRRAAALVEPKSPTVKHAMRTLNKARRREVEAVFAPELGVLAKAQHDVVLDALDVTSSGKTWDSLRHDMGLSQAAATNVIRVTITSLFSA